MLREPVEVTISEDGAVTIPLGLLAEAGLDPGSSVLAFSSGDGRVVLRRMDDAMLDILETGAP